MRILFISPYLPDESAGAAGSQLIFRIIEHLVKKKHDIYLLYLSNKGDNHSHLEKLGVNVRSVSFKRAYSYSFNAYVGLLFDRISVVLKSVINYTPYVLEKYRNTILTKEIIDIVTKEKIDIVQCEYNFIAQNIPLKIRIPKILIEHDVSMKLFYRFKMNSRNIIIRIISYYQLSLWQRNEPELCNSFDCVVTLTNDDKFELMNNGVYKKIVVINPPIKQVKIKESVFKEDAICFVGSYNRKPNIEAVLDLYEEIWPSIRDKRKFTKLYFAGKFLSNKMKKKISADKRVVYSGFVDDIDWFIASKMIFVAPLRLGSGFKMKITHSLSCGTPVITTSVGKEGIDVTEKEGLIVRDNYDDMVTEILFLLNNESQLLRLGKRAKETVAKKFNVNKAGAKYEKIYKELKYGNFLK